MRSMYDPSIGSGHRTWIVAFVYDHCTATWGHIPRNKCVFSSQSLVSIGQSRIHHHTTDDKFEWRLSLRWWLIPNGDEQTVFLTNFKHPGRTADLYARSVPPIACWKHFTDMADVMQMRKADSKVHKRGTGLFWSYNPALPYPVREFDRHQRSFFRLSRRVIERRSLDGVHPRRLGYRCRSISRVCPVVASEQSLLIRVQLAAETSISFMHHELFENKTAVLIFTNIAWLFTILINVVSFHFN